MTVPLPIPPPIRERIPVRELRNNVSDVIRRVESGQTFEITVNDRPVALLTPRSSRPRTMSTREFFTQIEHFAADPGLRDDLAELLTETTDDMPDPWEKHG